MKSLWIRVEAHAVDSVKIAQLADRLRVRTTEALGLYVALGGAIAEHTDDGVINDVPDETLERWGRWEGRRGFFAVAVREIFQSGHGHYDDWPDTMGKLVERRAKDRKRKGDKGDRSQVALEFPGASEELPRKVRGDSSATVRDGTERTTTTRPGAQTAAPARAEDASETTDELTTTFPAVMELVFTRFYVPDGKAPNDWNADRCGSIVRELKKGHGFDDIGRAIAGFALLRDHPGTYGDRLDWIRPQEKCTMRVLYETRTGVLPTFNAATNAYWKWAESLIGGRT